MGKQKKGIGPGRTVLLVVVGMLGLGLTLTMLLQGTDLRVLNPKGLIAGEQMKLIVFSVLVMMVIAIPTLGLLYYFAWKYRETSATATYNAHTKHGPFFSFSIWAIPTVFMLILASVMWPATHRLEPRKSIAADAKPLRVQVIAMRWKWLFIYPEQNIASVNFVQLPVDTPVTFELTADEAPMNSFWIPHLSGQLYAMTGHNNPLNIIANEQGDFPGSAAEINGRGFTGMKFTTRVSSAEDFDQWVGHVRDTSDVLDDKTYADLLKPSENNQAVYYASADRELYDKVLMKYGGGHGANHGSGSHNEVEHH